jgi:hypothetical protein
MKIWIPLSIALLIVAILMPACGPSQAMLDATATKRAVNIFAKLTAQAPSATATFTPSPTATFTPSPTATFTPSPTASNTPTPTVIPGWTKFETSSIEIWLPDSFQGGDIENDLDVIVSQLKSLGPDYEQIANMIEMNPSLFVLLAYDTEIGASGFLTSVNVGHAPSLSTITLDMYIKMVEQQLPPDYSVIDSSIVQLGGYEAARMVIEVDVSGVLAKELMYTIKDNNTLWAITYATGLDEFEQRLPVFEQSASTFFIKP